jgi:hypothetical protein
VHKAVEEKWGLAPSQLRCYFHYQPSYYHLHLHVTAVDYTPPGVNCEKSHLLETVIGNLELEPAHYQRATLSFLVREKEALYRAFSEHGYFLPAAEAELGGGEFRPSLRMWECLGRAKHEVTSPAAPPSPLSRAASSGKRRTASPPGAWR